MVNDLKAFDALSKEEIMKMTGQDDGSVISTGTIDRLTINRAAEDDDGNQLSAGVFSTYDSSIESKVYSIKDKPVQFRPFINAYQYMEYDPDNNNYPCSSVIFKSWKDEPIDTNGGIRCGKVIGKDKEQLTQIQIDAQRNIKCYRLVYGLVSMDATTPTGEPVKVEAMPVLFRVTGSNFTPIGESLKSLKGRDSLMQNHLLNLTTIRKKAGSNVYYVSQVNIDNKEVPFTAKDLEHMDMFNALIAEENTRVSTKWQNANSNKEQDAASAKVINELSDDPEMVLQS
jgi:hypothetical protein|tara:strand:- start:285 stop:1139 length:855 start_codon:yes stop_codon:yes gene_type:complete